jgi:hypothetical protein
MNKTGRSIRRNGIDPPTDSSIGDVEVLRGFHLRHLPGLYLVHGIKSGQFFRRHGDDFHTPAS